MQGLVAGLTFADRFTLVRPLGHGGMGEVWLADDAVTDAPVALKLLDPRLAAQPEYVDMLREECARARALVHPNIVRVYDFHEREDRVAISMQYIEGDTLASLRGATFQVVVRQVLMVCDALAYAHRNGIIHHDIKSSNVLIDASGIAYLTDFGIAAAISPDSVQRATDLQGVGSLPSMSPQQLDGQVATVADDVYGVGALIYELLSGSPLFHPDVSAERVRHDVPAAVASDGCGQPVPKQLAQLVQAMLDKSPDRRPAGVGAVRSVLEDIRDDYPEAAARDDDAGVIRPVSRDSDTRPGASSGDSAPPPRRLEPGGKGLPPGVVYGALAALVAVALTVIFVLPQAVQKQRRAVVADPVVGTPAPPEVAPDSDAADAAELKTQRRLADDALGDLLMARDRVEQLGIDVWGDVDWNQATQLAAAGDAEYRQRRYTEAATIYRQALNQMKLLEQRAPDVLAQAMRDGVQAIESKDQPGAIGYFERALAIAPDNAEALAGLDRAMHVDEVIELTRQGAEYETTGQLKNAAARYEAALAIDPAWQTAIDGRARSTGQIRQLDYETRMADGFAAMGREDFDAARTAFAAAKRIRPGDADATAALAQIESEVRLAKVLELQVAARIAEAGENWTAAADAYDKILQIDSTVAAAQDSVERARYREALAADLDDSIAHGDQLNDERTAGVAGERLARARAVESPGKVLQSQMSRLDELLRVASVPVPVEFQSDNLTEVVIYKVGSLGTFQSRMLDLKPGRYVAVGRRDGYRDVRRNFSVLPGGNPQLIVLSCEEPI